MSKPNRSPDPDHAESADEPDKPSGEPLDMSDRIAAVLASADPRNTRDVDPAVKAVVLPAARRLGRRCEP